KSSLITTEPAAPTSLDRDRSILLDPSRRFFKIGSDAQKLFSVTKLLDFEQRPSILEPLAQPHEPVCSQSAATARLGHLRRVIDAVHPGVGTLQHHKVAATPFIFAMRQYPALECCAIAKIEHDQRQPCVRYRHAVSGQGLLPVPKALQSP